MRKNGRTLTEDIRLIRRGMKEFGTFLPGQLRLLFLHCAVTAVIPYIGIGMLSAVISELSDRRRVWVLVTVVAAALALTLLLTVVSAFTGKRIAVGYDQLFPAHEIRLNEKANAMRYSLLEDEKTRELRDEVSGSIDCSGAGMGSLYWDCEAIFKALLSAAVSIGILVFNAGGSGTLAGKSGGVLDFADSVWGYLALAAIILVSAAVSSKLTSRIFDVSFDVFKNGAKYNRYANFYKLEYLSDDKTAQDVRLYSQKELIRREVLDKCYIPFADGDRREKITTARSYSVMLLMSAVTGGAVYILVGAGAMHGRIGTGSVLLLYSAVTMLIRALTDIAQTVTDLRNNNEHLNRYFAYVSMAEEPDVPAPTDAAEAAAVEIENVSFRYPGSSVPALKNISLSVESGQKVALVGVNGSGKTTLVKLLCGLYDTTEGTIRINGADVSAADRAGDRPSVVFQDFSLLSLPVGCNVAAAGVYDEAGVWDALDKVGVGDKVRSFPMRLEQPLFKNYDDRGAELSGGEAQKLAIARSIYRDAALLILDEPTAALDPFAEYAIFTKMREIAQDKTTLFISHRLYSCRFCDRIVVMDNGRIVQTGTHDELVAVPGRYAEMWNAQAQHYAQQNTTE